MNHNRFIRIKNFRDGHLQQADFVSCLLGTGDGNAEEFEGLLLDCGRAGEDGEGSFGSYRRDDRIAREGGQVGQQALEAVHGRAFGGASGGALGEGGGRTLRLGDGA